MTRYAEVLKLVNYQRLCGNCVDFTFATRLLHSVPQT